jgi:hypothetical protein
LKCKNTNASKSKRNEAPTDIQNLKTLKDKDITKDIKRKDKKTKETKIKQNKIKIKISHSCLII